MMKSILAALILLFAPLLTMAAVPTWTILPNDSQLTFTATQNGAPIKGEFKKFMGVIKFDPAALKESSVDILVDMNSLSMSYKEAEATLISPDWFNAKLFPQAEFKANDFTKLSADRYQAKGTLTLRDKSAPVTLLFTINELSDGKDQVKGNATLQRTVFGVGQGEWAKTDAIKDDVLVEFQLVATKK